MVISGRTDASNSPRRLPEGPDTRQENPIRAATPRQNLVRDTDLPPPHPTDAIRGISTAIAWFMWQGEIFRVPLSTLQREKNDSGWNLYNAEAKSRALIMYRLQKQSQQEGTITADWLKYRNLNTKLGNPPYPAGIRRRWDIFEHMQ